MRQAWAVFRYNFKGFFRNPRIIITFILAFILCFLLSERVMTVAEYYKLPMQVAEPFIWTFGDRTAIMLISLLLILIFIDLPKLNHFTPYILSRIKKRHWLLGQFLYIIGATVVYFAVVMVMTAVLCMKRTFIGNQWSKTAALLGYSKLGEEMAVPSTVKVMEGISPYGCMLEIIMLMLLYSLTLCFVMLFFAMKIGKKAGIVAGLVYSISGYLLETNIIAQVFHIPEYNIYQANIIVGWISPLNHAVYQKHNFGYDRLPTLSQSALFFLIILLVFAILSYRLLKKYHFSTFTGD